MIETSRPITYIQAAMVSQELRLRINCIIVSFFSLFFLSPGYPRKNHDVHQSGHAI